jgi:hypothetical protein
MKNALGFMLLSTALVLSVQAKNSGNSQVVKAINSEAAYALVDLTGGVKHDTGALTVKVLASEAESVSSANNLQWKRVDEQTESVVARGVHLQKKDKRGFIDSLTYAAWDMAGTGKIKFLHVFYFIPEQKVSFRARGNPSMLGGGYTTDSSATMQLTYVLIDMAKNRVVAREVSSTFDTDSKGFMRENETALRKLSRKLFEKLQLTGTVPK